MLSRVGQDNREEAIETVARRIKELDTEEANLTRAIRAMGDKLGIDRLIEALSAAASEKQKAEP